MSDGQVSIPHIRALDGLRGAAVTGVVLYHGGHLKGGYLGVDLFFVLSGYLITSLLLAEWRVHHRIALGAFWARRARRLLPALVVVFLGVIVYLVAFAEPNEFSQIRGDAFATIGYVANWRSIFAGQSYFNLFTAPSPLQHTWSLAIEEQFYVFWPLIFVGIGAWWKERVPQAVLVTAIVLGATSGLLMVSLYNVADPNRAYFGTDTRAFALFAGIAIAAVVALRGHANSLRWRVALELTSAASVFLLAGMWTTVEGLEPRLYQGGFAMAGGAAAVVIAAAVHPRRGPVGWLLSFPPLCWLGLISYGLYLWHWPVDVVLTGDRTGLVGWSLFAVRTATAVGIATASYFLIEMPIRRGALRSSQWRIVIPAVAATLLVTIVVTTVADRQPTVLRENLPPSTFHASRKQLVEQRRGLDARIGAKIPRVLAVGDSIALTLVSSAPNRPRSQFGVLGATMLGCGIVRGEPIGLLVSPGEQECGRAPALWRDSADVAEPARVVVIPGSWDLFDRMVDGKRVGFGSREYERLLGQRLSAARAIAHQHRSALVLLSLPCFEPAAHLPEAVRSVFGDARRVLLLNRLVRKYAMAHAGVTFVDLYQYMCPGDRYDPDLRATDGVHFSKIGAAKVWRWLFPQLAAVRTTA